MFKFDFDIDDTDPDLPSESFPAPTNAQTTLREEPNAGSGFHSFSEIATEALLRALPPLLSYSPLVIPLLDGQDLVISRRDLHDARFQIISEESMDQELHLLDDPSDLIPGVYEGGLKTWECSLDLAAFLREGGAGSHRNETYGKRILELGCGTAVPSISLLCNIFNSPPSSNGPPTTIHLQDFNELVFRLVTFPNILLAWYTSPASALFRESKSTTVPSDDDSNPLPPPDPTQDGDLPITPALTSAFLESLRVYNIEIRFFCGSWDSFDVKKTGGTYDLILTSETVYRMDSLPSLVGLMQRACVSDSSTDESLSEQIGAKLVIDEKGTLEKRPPICLVAAKLVYFGVGGGVSEFVKAAEGYPASGEGKRNGETEVVWEKKEGVKRCILQVCWS